MMSIAALARRFEALPPSKRGTVIFASTVFLARGEAKTGRPSRGA